VSGKVCPVPPVSSSSEPSPVRLGGFHGVFGDCVMILPLPAGAGSPLTGGNIPEGAYGFAISGVASHDLLLPVPSSGWRELRIERHAGPRPPSPVEVRIDAEGATFPLRTGGFLQVDRRTRTATYATPQRLSDDDLIHPYLVPAAAVCARWLGRQALHAGGFANGGGAWALIGTRESGKSTTLAALHERGCDVLSDDVVVLDGRTALAGPRSIDLRGPALGAPATHRVRLDSRERLLLPPVAGEFEIEGLVFLEWGDAVELVRVDVGDRLRRLIPHRMATRLQEDAAGLLGLAALPAWELRRPRRLSELSAAVDRLLELAGAG
jgi:hypothetical protein